MSSSSLADAGDRDGLPSIGRPVPIDRSAGAGVSRLSPLFTRRMAGRDADDAKRDARRCAEAAMDATAPRAISVSDLRGEGCRMGDLGAGRPSARLLDDTCRDRDRSGWGAPLGCAAQPGPESERPQAGRGSQRWHHKLCGTTVRIAPCAR